MRVRKGALLALVALALAAAGCGGGDESGSAAEATTGTETTAVDTTAGDTTETESTSTDEATSTDESVVTDIGDLSGECLSLAGVGAKYAQALQEAGGPDGDLTKYADVFDEFAEQAPAEIRSDLEVIAKNIAKYAEALKDLDLTSGAAPSADQLQKLQELSKSFDQADLQKASANIEAWVQENCTKS